MSIMPAMVLLMYGAPAKNLTEMPLYTTSRASVRVKRRGRRASSSWPETSR